MIDNFFQKLITQGSLRNCGLSPGNLGSISRNLRSDIVLGTQLLTALSGEEVECQNHFLVLKFLTRKSSQKFGRLAQQLSTIFNKLTPNLLDHGTLLGPI